MQPCVDVEHRRGVAHRARDDALDREPAERSPTSGPNDVRPRDGFRPTSPHSLAGMRIEPPPSFACAAGDHARRDRRRRAAARAAGRVRRVPRIARRAVRVAARSSAGCRARACSSGRGRRARRARNLRPDSVSCGARKPASFRKRVAAVAAGRPPSAPMRSFSRNGTPRNGPSGSSVRRAASRARSKQRWITAFSCGFSASIRSIAASTSSSGRRLPRPHQLGLRVASSRARSSPIGGRLRCAPASVQPGLVGVVGSVRPRVACAAGAGGPLGSPRRAATPPMARSAALASLATRTQTDVRGVATGDGSSPRRCGVRGAGGRRADRLSGSEGGGPRIRTPDPSSQASERELNERAVEEPVERVDRKSAVASGGRPRRPGT